ncbi:MAG: hypothetical protein MRJ93_12670 [Nitrososphaeraceae archaeon]|nr:hypothetical protein [Nitrososphaeraceae archaeon]
MKGLIFYVTEGSFDSLNEILHKNKVEGISYFDIMGRGKLKREEVEKIIKSYAYRTGEKYVPDYAPRKRVEVIIPESEAEKLLTEVKKGTIKGRVFVFDVSESYDLP